MTQLEFSDKVWNLQVGNSFCFQDKQGGMEYIVECFHRNDITFILVTMFGINVAAYLRNQFGTKDQLANEIYDDFGISDSIKLIDNIDNLKGDQGGTL